MDNVFWVVIAAAVAIALAGIVLFIGSESLEGVMSDADDTQEGATCGFLESEIDAGRIDPDDSQWEDEIEDCPNI